MKISLPMKKKKEGKKQNKGLKTGPLRKKNQNRQRGESKKKKRIKKGDTFAKKKNEVEPGDLFQEKLPGNIRTFRKKFDDRKI